MSKPGGIGGFLGLEPLVERDQRLHPGALRLSTARACLMRILMYVQPRVVFLPTWICPALLEPMEATGIRTIRYPLGEDLLPLPPLDVPSESLFIMLNPFGVGDQAVRKAADVLGARLVVDTVQALYQPPPDGSWGFASARKFLGVPDGAFLWSPEPLPGVERRNNRVHADHLVARASGLSEALKLYHENEACMSADDEAPSALSEAILDRLNHSETKRRRQANYRFLHTRLKETNCLCLPDALPSQATPLYYPFLPPCEISRSDLHEQRIWVSQMWPELDSDPHADSWSKHLARRLLPLPIDQRYGEPEMRLILSALHRLRIDAKANRGMNA